MSPQGKKKKGRGLYVLDLWKPVGKVSGIQQGRLAQLAERQLYTLDVTGSSPVSPTIKVYLTAQKKFFIILHHVGVVD